MSTICFVLPVVSDVDKLAGVSLAVVTEEHGASAGKGSLELGAGFVESLVTLQQLDDKDGELLERAWAYRNRDSLYLTLLAEMNLIQNENVKTNNIISPYFLIPVFPTCHHLWSAVLGVKLQVSTSPSTARLAS